MSTDKGPIIGVDFGTINMCVAVFQNGRVEIIPNEQGNLLTPSYIAFTRIGRLFGDEAKDQLLKNSQNTIFHCKKIISLSDDSLATFQKRANRNFDLKADYLGNLKICVSRRDETETFLPEDICAMMLNKTKQTAQAYLGQKVTNAVIAVPARFKQSDRHAIIDAGRIAGLNVFLIHETSAAALAYGMQQNIKEDKKILIFNLGGLFLNVSVVEFSGNGHLKIKSIAGDGYVGGDCFDMRLVNHCVQEFKTKYKKDLTSCSRALNRLLLECENAKKVLSSNLIATVQIDSLFEGIDFSFNITRTRFEELCADLFRSFLEPTEKSLRDAKCGKSDIKQIFLVGGSTRIPKIQELLRDFFNFKDIFCMEVIPDEAVAYGAAIQAAIINKEVERIYITDVSAHSIGIETPGGVMNVVVERNCEISCKIPKIIHTEEDFQSIITIKVFEGENLMTRDNYFLGQFHLSDIPPSQKGRAIQLSFHFDFNGFVDISAFDVESNKTMTVIVTSKRLGLSEVEIEERMKVAKQYDVEDQVQRERLTVYNSFQNYIYAMKEISKSPQGNNLTLIEKEEMERTCEEALEWLDFHSLADKTEIHRRMSEYKLILGPMIEKIRSKGTHNNKPSESRLLHKVLSTMDEIEAIIKK